MKMPGIHSCVLGLALVPVTIISTLLSFQLITGKIDALDAALRERAASMTRQLGPAAESRMASGDIKALQQLIERVAEEPDVHGVAVFSADGRSVIQAGSVKWPDTIPHTLPTDQLYQVEQTDRLIYYVPIDRPSYPLNAFKKIRDDAPQRLNASNALLGWIGVEFSRDNSWWSQRNAVKRSSYVLLTGLFASFMLAWLFGRELMGPLRELTQKFKRMGEGHLDERVSTKGFGELCTLQESVNTMMTNLQAINEEMQEKLDRATGRLVYQASHDALTGLINRWEFEQRLEAALQSALHQQREHVLCYMDLDQFKIINDTSGHGAGDELLRQLAMMFKGNLRERDTLARLGGDEFALLLENCTIEAAIEIVDVFRADVQRYRFKWDERVFSIGMSIGMVAINATSRTSARLLSAADTACYMAKDRGRNRIHVYESRDSELVHHRGEMLWITHIHKAMEENRLRLTWQEIFRLQPDSAEDKQKHPRHVELLLRMQQEDGTEILPMAFIPAAERYLIMPALDTWVIEETLRICQRYREKTNDRHCLFAVNLSGSSLKDPAFRGVLLSALRKQPETGPHLCFEITETATLGNLSAVNDFIHAMREFGCCFALDDFGSGLSSFTYLKNLKVDFLKIDGAFVRDIASNPLDRSMVDAIYRIGHQMGLVTVAEYVETDQVLMILRQIGVECGQGNLLHAPQPMEAFWESYTA